jgi:hypothetical protein
MPLWNPQVSKLRNRIDPEVCISRREIFFTGRILAMAAILILNSHSILKNEFVFIFICSFENRNNDLCYYLDLMIDC